MFLFLHRRKLLYFSFNPRNHDRSKLQRGRSRNRPRKQRWQPDSKLRTRLTAHEKIRHPNNSTRLFIRETEPAYVIHQPHFLNSAVRANTKLGPLKLLQTLKDIERDMGQTAGISPLTDVLVHDTENDDVARFWHDSSGFLGGIFEAWEKWGPRGIMRRVLPVSSGLWDWSEKTWVMGDSFSDGGKFVDVKSVVDRAKSILADGADIIDIGAQSTRPMAEKLSPKQELSRLIPVLDAVMDLPEIEGKLISVDTFYLEVALGSGQTQR
ncbi:dihydropteroate synthase [Striga asiatica]|uniref:2-amino-4-hydroxy-6-hydroxymethyldihydropteridine diphosphokinase n=1 Tax=Striga asiatica TaxID=4170 RepID=A0A5A7PGS4_STRAF|nr:dihydropteroate synthase [Striga asiatica]